MPVKAGIKRRYRRRVRKPSRPSTRRRQPTALTARLFRAYPRNVKVPGTSRMRSTTACFKYTDRVTLAPGGVKIGAQHVFRLNSIYDVDYTAAGHQPYLHDTVSQAWSLYEVDYALVIVRAYPTTAIGNDLISFSVDGFGSAPDLSSTQADQIEERGIARVSRRMPPMATAVGDVKVTTMKTLIPMRKYQQLPDRALYGGSMGSNPTTPIYGTLSYNAVATNSNSITCDVTIYQFCKLRLKVDLGES